MTFISEQTPNAEGKIQVIKEKRRIFEEGEVQEDGTIKGKARIKIEYEDIDLDGAENVGNLLATEAWVLDEGNVFWAASTPPLNHIAPEARLAHRIGNARANIANFSKRGMGNTIIFHPTLADRVEEAMGAMKAIKVPANPMDPECEEMVDDEVPYFQEGEMTLIEHDAAPEEKVLVMYRGEEDYDQPLIYVEGHGLVKNEVLAGVDTYGKFVRVP